MGDPLSTVLGLPGVFMSCVQCFELIQSGRDQERDLLVLTTKFSNQQLRFTKWGEACGFGSPEGYNKGLDGPDLKPCIERTLRSIKLLLDSGVTVSKAYEKDAAKEHAIVSNRAVSTRWSWTTVIRTLRRSQDARGAKDAFQWAVADKKKLDEIVRHLGDLINDLEIITKDLGVPERQRILVQYEIQSISDAETLELMEASRLGSEDIVSDTASVRLRSLHTTSQPSSHQPGSILDVLSVPDTYNTAESYSTAPEVISSIEEMNTFAAAAQNNRIMAEILSQAEPVPRTGSEVKVDPSRLGRLVDNLSLEAFDQTLETHPLFYEGSQDTLTGRIIRRVRKEFQQSQLESEIKGSRWYNTHYISSNLRYILGSIEGPINTPYEGGIFHLALRVGDKYPFKAPACRMLTKVYHPNIGPNGEVCISILEEAWEPSWTLTQIMIAIASLLEDPGLEDPLVPEIAETYVRNRSLYDENARAYTQRHAWELCPTPETTQRFIRTCEELKIENKGSQW